MQYSTSYLNTKLSSVNDKLNEFDRLIDDMLFKILKHIDLNSNRSHIAKNIDVDPISSSGSDTALKSSELSTLQNFFK